MPVDINYDPKILSPWIEFLKNISVHSIERRRYLFSVYLERYQDSPENILYVLYTINNPRSYLYGFMSEVIQVSAVPEVRRKLLIKYILSLTSKEAKNVLRLLREWPDFKKKLFVDIPLGLQHWVFNRLRKSIKSIPKDYRNDKRYIDRVAEFVQYQLDRFWLQWKKGAETIEVAVHVDRFNFSSQAIFIQIPKLYPNLHLANLSLQGYVKNSFTYYIDKSKNIILPTHFNRISTPRIISAKDQFDESARSVGTIVKLFARAAGDLLKIPFPIPDEEGEEGTPPSLSRSPLMKKPKSESPRSTNNRSNSEPEKGKNSRGTDNKGTSKSRDSRASRVEDEISDDVDRAFKEDAPFETGDLRSSGRMRRPRSEELVPPFDSLSLTRAQRTAMRRISGQRLSPNFQRAWRTIINNNSRARREIVEIQRLFNNGQAQAARRLARDVYNRARTRFWRYVRGSNALRRELEAAGLQFSGSRGSAPYWQFSDGFRERLTLEHMNRVTDAPWRAVAADNFQFVPFRVNVKTLEWIRGLPEFQ